MKTHHPAKRWIVAAAVVAAVLSVVVATWWGNGSNETSYDEVAVSICDIQPTVLSTGTVAPENRLEIKPPIAGRIDDVLIREGDEIKKGQMLVKMSSTERAALLDAARAQSAAELNQWQTYYKPAPILAPIDGTIIVRSAEAGQTVTNNDVILVMSDRLTVKARVDETDIGSIKLKQRADIVLDAYPDDTIEGIVDKIAYDSKTVNNVTTYIVDVLPNSVPQMMRSGMTSNVTFSLDPRKDVLCLPNNAVQLKDGRSFVLIPRDKTVGKPVVHDVMAGISDSSNIEIREGLKAGEKVLIQKLVWKGDDDSKKSNPFMPTRPKAKGSK